VALPRPGAAEGGAGVEDQEGLVGVELAEGFGDGEAEDAWVELLAAVSGEGGLVDVDASRFRRERHAGAYHDQVVGLYCLFSHVQAKVPRQDNTASNWGRLGVSLATAGSRLKYKDAENFCDKGRVQHPGVER
jgi:hypothetical protein